MGAPTSPPHNKSGRLDKGGNRAARGQRWTEEEWEHWHAEKARRPQKMERRKEEEEEGDWRSWLPEEKGRKTDHTEESYKEQHPVEASTINTALVEMRFGDDF